MADYTVLVGTHPESAEGEYCDLEVIEEDGMGNQADIPLLKVSTTIRTDHPDVLGVINEAADRVLAEHGWQRSTEWEYDTHSIYARVVRPDEWLSDEHGPLTQLPPEDDED